MALGDLIYIQLNSSIVGTGNKGDVIQVVETAFIEALMAANLVTVVAGPGAAYAQAAVGELASSENATGTLTAGTSGGALIPSTTISLPASSRPLYIDYGGAFAITAFGTGQIAIVLEETTSGSAVIFDSAVQKMDATVSATGAASKSGFTVGRSARIGTRVATSTWALYAYVLQDSSSALAGNVVNKARGAGVPTSIYGYAR